MAKNKKMPREKETELEKMARWSKNLRAAKAFAKQAGLLKIAQDERQRNENTRLHNTHAY